MSLLTIVGMPLQAVAGLNTGARAPVPPQEQRVLWMHASFPYPYGTPAREVALLKSPDKAKAHWSPTTRDFDEIAKYEVVEHNKKFNGMATHVLITNLLSFVAAFATMPDGKVARVNIITHADTGLIALSGTVDGTNGATHLGETAPFDPNLDPEPARQRYLNHSFGLDEASFFLGTLGKGWFNDPEQGRPDRNKIRAKLAPGAEFHIYACDTANGSALNDKLMRTMANTFDARVFGFASPIYYHPTVVGPRIVERRITGVGNDEADAIAHENRGLLHNDQRTPFVREFKPTTPAP